MATVSVYQVKFQIVSMTGKPGPAYQYRKDIRTAQVQAASIHPKDLLTVINNNVSLVGNETVEILQANQVGGGTEGASVVWT